MGILTVLPVLFHFNKTLSPLKKFFLACVIGRGPLPPLLLTASMRSLSVYRLTLAGAPLYSAVQIATPSFPWEIGATGAEVPFTADAFDGLSHNDLIDGPSTRSFDTGAKRPYASATVLTSASAENEVTSGNSSASWNIEISEGPEIRRRCVSWSLTSGCQSANDFCWNPAISRGAASDDCSSSEPSHQTFRFLCPASPSSTFVRRSQVKRNRPLGEKAMSMALGSSSVRAASADLVDTICTLMGIKG